MAKKTVSVDIDDSLHLAAKAEAVKRRMPITAAYEQALSVWLAKSIEGTVDTVRPVPDNPLGNTTEKDLRKMLDGILASGNAIAISASRMTLMACEALVHAAHSRNAESEPQGATDLAGKVAGVLGGAGAGKGGKRRPVGRIERRGYRGTGSFDSLGW